MDGINNMSRADKHRAAVKAIADQARAAGNPMTAIDMEIRGHEHASRLEREDAASGERGPNPSVYINMAKLLAEVRAAIGAPPRP